DEPCVVLRRVGLDGALDGVRRGGLGQGEIGASWGLWPRWYPSGGHTKRGVVRDPSRTTPPVRPSVGGARPTGQCSDQPPLSPWPRHETSGFQSLNVPSGLLL